MPSNYTPRLSIELTEEQHSKLSHLIDWGQKRALFGAIVDGLIPLLEEYGAPLIAVIVSGKLSVVELIDLFEKDKKGNSE